MNPSSTPFVDGTPQALRPAQVQAQIHSPTPAVNPLLLLAPDGASVVAKSLRVHPHCGRASGGEDRAPAPPGALTRSRGRSCNTLLQLRSLPGSESSETAEQGECGARAGHGEVHWTRPVTAGGEEPLQVTAEDVMWTPLERARRARRGLLAGPEESRLLHATQVRVWTQ